MPIRVYSSEEGLAGDGIRDLRVDSRGFLWVATSSGLSRFDGRTFVNYDVGSGLPSPAIETLAETRDGALWAGTYQGLSVLRPSTRSGEPAFNAVPTSDVPFAKNVLCLLEDRAGRLWVGTGSGLLVAEDPQHLRLRAIDLGLQLPGIQDREVNALAEGSEGDLWVGTNFGLARRSPSGLTRRYRVQPPDSQGKDEVHALAMDGEGRLWVGLSLGVLVYRPEPFAGDSPTARPLSDRARLDMDPGGAIATDAKLPERPGEAVFFRRAGGARMNWVTGFARGSEGEMWASTENGLLEFARGRRRVRFRDQGLAENYLTAVTEDRAGNLWIGSDSRGLMRLARNGFSSYGEADGLGSDRIASVFESRAGELMVSSRGHLYRLDGSRFADVTPGAVAGAAHGTWGSHQLFLETRGGDWWMPTAQGLFRFAPVEGTAALRQAAPRAVYRAPTLPGEDVHRIFEDRHGDVWVSLIAPQPLAVWRRAEERFRQPRLLQGRVNGAPTAFAEDHAGNLWLGFYGGGLARVRGERWEFFDAANGVPAGFIWDLHCDRVGRLWVASAAGGVGRLDDPDAPAPRFRRYTTTHGLSTDAIDCITEDREGRLYFGTRRGVDRLDPDSGVVRSFTTGDGLPSARVHVCAAHGDGTIWFGTLHGLASFDPARWRTPADAPPVLFSGLRVRDVVRPLAQLGERAVDGLRLEPPDDSLALDYFGLAPNLGEPLRYQYRLEGVDAGWSAPTQEQTLRFPRLSAGGYHLLVRALSADGEAGPAAAVSFRVLPPLWRRPWLLVCDVLAAGLAVWLWHRARLGRALAMERVRTHIAGDLHDEVGASLSWIARLSDLADERLQRDPEAAHRMLAQITTISRELIEATSDIVWAIDPRRDDLESLLVRLRRIAADLLADRGVRLQFAPPSGAAGVALSSERRRDLYLLLKEAIHNVAKHASAHQVDVRFELGGGRLAVEVADDGVGFDARQVTGEGHGLRSMRRRAQALGAGLEIHSAPSRGTCLRLELPL